MLFQWLEEEYPLGDFTTETGDTLRDGRLRYLVTGRLSPERDNLVLLPTHYGGAMHANRAWVEHTDSPLSPDRFCIVIPALFGNGESSSPSTAADSTIAAAFPRLTIGDNIRAQRSLLDARFAGARIALVAGWSMGGIQALHWAADDADRIERALAVCATARCYPHNAVFLDGIKAALEADPAADRPDTVPARGLRAFARVYAGWAYSQRFFRDGLYRELGFDSIDAVLQHWEADHLGQHPQDLLAMLATWQSAVLSDHALAGITADTRLMPGSTDLYFTAEDVARDAALIPRAVCQPLDSDYGHYAGGPGYVDADTRQVIAAMRELLGG